LAAGGAGKDTLACAPSKWRPARLVVLLGRHPVAPSGDR
jgi:hypothetical protein